MAIEKYSTLLLRPGQGKRFAVGKILTATNQAAGWNSGPYPQNTERIIERKILVQQAFNTNPPTGLKGLFNGLVSYWKLDDAANGTRLDAWGPNNLTDSLGNVGQDNSGGIACTPKPGFVHCAGGFGQTSNNGTRLKITDAAQSGLGLGSGKSFTCSLWTFGNSGSTTSNVMGKWSQTAGLQDYALFVNQYTGPFWYYSITGFDLTNTQRTLDLPGANGGGAPSAYRMNAAAWAMIVWGYDDATQTMHLTMGGVDLTSNYPAFTIPVVGVRKTACDFQIGSIDPVSTRPYWGSIDEVGFWNRKLTAAEVSQLWNSGNGLPFGSFS